MITFTDGPLEGCVNHHIPMDFKEPTLIEWTKKEDGPVMKAQGLYSFADGVPTHHPSDQDSEFGPLPEHPPVVAETRSEPDPIAALVAQYLAVQKIRPAQAAKLRPRFIEHLKSKGCADPESLLP